MDKKIIIIGSGASGIAAGTKLIEYGYENVLIVEAENRIGGRIHTINFGENILDLGAQWCHGEKNNVVYEIAKNYQNDIFDSTGDIYFKFNCIKSNKEKLSDDVTSKLTELIEKCIDSDQAKDEMKKFNGSLGEYITKKYNDELEKSEYASINKSDAKIFFDFYSKFESSLDAPDTLFDISASGLTRYWECDGDQLLNWKGKGYKTILKILMNSTDDKPYGKLNKKILLNKKVEEIHWNDDDEQGKIYIRCTDGDKIEADHLICTVSLGVLKEKHLTLFNPPLPQLKVRAIEGLGIGNVDKMFIEFSSKFWPNNWPGMCLLWEDDDLKMISERNDNWIEDVFGFFPVDCQPNVLCGWIVGVNGRRMEIQSDDDVLNGLMFLLKKFLKWDISEPNNFIRSTWYINQNFRGSYSYHSVNADKLNTSASDLAYPLTDDQHNGKLLLQFAGEATHDHYFSTVHGAIETGWREAKRLNDYYNKNKSHL